MTQISGVVVLSALEICIHFGLGFVLRVVFINPRITHYIVSCACHEEIRGEDFRRISEWISSDSRE